MAYVKRIFIKSSLSKAVNYISSVEEKLAYITKEHKVAQIGSLNCSNKYTIALLQMEQLKKEFNKAGGYLAHHYVQSFKPNEISIENAFKIAKEFAEKNFPNAQVLYGTHQDKEHFHNHFIINSVQLDGKKVDATNSKLYKTREISDSLCKKYKLSIIDTNFNIKHELIKDDIDNAIKKANSFHEFRKILISDGYKIKEGKYISFTPKGYGKATRNKENILGNEYTTESIKLRIGLPKNEKNVDIKEKDEKINVMIKTIKNVNNYSDKNTINLKKEIIKFDISESIKKSNSFEKFIENMELKNYKITESKGNLYYKHHGFKYAVKDINLDKNLNKNEIQKKILNKGLIIFDSNSKDRMHNLALNVLSQIVYVTKEKSMDELDAILEKISFINKYNVFDDKTVFLDAIKNNQSLLTQSANEIKIINLAYRELDKLETNVNYFNENKGKREKSHEINTIRNYFAENGIDENRLDRVLINVKDRKQQFTNKLEILQSEFNRSKKDIACSEKIINDYQEIEKEQKRKI